MSEPIRLRDVLFDVIGPRDRRFGRSVSVARRHTGFVDVAGCSASRGGAAALLVLLAGVALAILGRGWRSIGVSVVVFALGLGMVVLAVVEGFQSRLLAVGGLVAVALGAATLLVAAAVRVLVVVSQAAQGSGRGRGSTRGS